MSNPKLFISYCWSNEEHEKWVIQLGSELRDNGVDVILDKWDLKEGNDANAFMEKMVTDDEIKKVILVIDEMYSEKADKREGGVGTETQIISAEVYESVNQNKFVAVIAKRDEKGHAKLPVFYKSRIYIDLSNEDLYGKNFEQLLRWIYDKPFNVKPELGKKPAFLEKDSVVSLGTSIIFRRLIYALKNSKPNLQGTMIEYFDKVSSNLERFRLDPSNGDKEFDQKIIDSIEQFIPFRNELIEVFSTIARYSVIEDYSIIHKFFESLIPYIFKPADIRTYHKWDWDNLKFIIHEIFILCIAVFLKYERFDVVEYLLSHYYLVKKNDDYLENEMRPFGIFRNYIESFKYRNDRLQLNRLSVHADIIKSRCTDYGFSFEYVMQADFVLYLLDSLQCLNENRRWKWWPDTLIFSTFHRNVFEIFLRAESTQFFNKIASIFNVTNKSDFDGFLKAYNDETILVPTWDFDRFNPKELMNYDKLCSRP